MDKRGKQMENFSGAENGIEKIKTAGRFIGDFIKKWKGSPASRISVWGVKYSDLFTDDAS